MLLSFGMSLVMSHFPSERQDVVPFQKCGFELGRQFVRAVEFFFLTHSVVDEHACLSEESNLMKLSENF